VGRFKRNLSLQVLLGLSSQGQVQLTELLTPLRPIQMLTLARMRWTHFAAVEVWDDAVCVLRLPPGQGPRTADLSAL
jgi:hypothetical protein